MKHSYESLSGAMASEPSSRRTMQGREEALLSPEEEVVYTAYRDEYQSASPDRQGINYRPEHLRWVLEQRMQDGEPDHTERSILFDRIMFTHKDWWGGNVDIYRASEFDDRKNSTDLILEFVGSEGERLGILSIDTTVPNDNEGTLGKKLSKIANNLERGQIGQLNYGPSIDEDFEYIGDVPQIIIAINPIVLQRISIEIAKELGQKSNGSAKNDKENKGISSHPISEVFLDEAIAQLRVQAKYFEDHELPENRKNRIMGKLNGMIEILEGVRKEKNPHLNLEMGSAEASGWRNSMSEYLTNPDLMKKICPQLFS